MSLVLIRGAERFAPESLGTGDVLVAGSEVLSLDPVQDGPSQSLPLEVVDAGGKLLLPGLVDVLTHPCGGGGEGGFGNRTPELEASDFIRAGVTTPVGALGTDSIGRTLEVLYGTTMALRDAGLNALMYSGAYRVPAPTLTGDIARDLYLVSPVIGVGEVAISDHRGSQPSAEELRRLAADTQLGGILAGAGGTVLVHVGDGDRRLQPLEEALAETALPRRVFYPTHINRSQALIEEGAAWTRGGGYVDITVSTTPELVAAGDITALDAFQRLLDAGADARRITCSSDAGGSLPLYVNGELCGLTAASSDVLAELLVQALRAGETLFEAILATVTSNAAAALGLASVGQLSPGRRADLVLMDADSGALTDVMSGGRWLLRDGALTS